MEPEPERFDSDVHSENRFSVSQGILESLVASQALLCAFSPRFVDFSATEASLALFHQHLLHFFSRVSCRAKQLVSAA